MSKFKQTKAITLVALVITIIVLLILAGVSISMLTGDNGILNKATEAKENTDNKTVEEKVQVEVMGSYGINGNIEMKELNDNLRKNISGLTYNGNEISEDDSNRILTLPATVVVDIYNVTINGDGKISVDILPTYTTYNVGEQITLKSTGENFYVIKPSSSYQENVTLLAANNLDTTPFSNKYYWSSQTYPYNLNDVDIPSNVVLSAVKIAKEYGATRGGIGRLMTLEEVLELGGNMSTFSTSGCPDWINLGRYWLGTAEDYRSVWFVNGDGKVLQTQYNDTGGYDTGVRPVIEISKSAF